jgi:hypothetical protein
VIAAFREVGDLEYRSKLPKVIAAIDRVIEDPGHKDHVKVLHSDLDRVGMHAVSESRTTVRHEGLSDADLRARLLALCEKLDIMKMLTKTATPPTPLTAIDTEYTEVPAPSNGEARGD